MRERTGIAPAVLVALLVLAYAPTIRARFLIWDDNDHVYENPYIMGERGYVRAWQDWRDPSFYPLTFTTFYAEWRLADGEPWLFHLDNAALHAANAVQVGLLGMALGLSAGTAWTAAGIWGLHPMEVASVAWIAERKNVLSVFFYLAALLTYARALDGGRDRWRWALSVVLSVAALLSKATAVTVPIALVLVHLARGRRLDAAAVGRLIPYFAAALLIGSLHVAREHVTHTLGSGTRVLIAARAVWFYVGKFLWPSGLVAVYPLWPPAEAPRWGAPALFGLAVVAGIAILLRHRLGRAAWFAAGFFVLNIALVVGVIWFPYMRFSFVADHLAYTANIGLAFLATLAGGALVRRLAAPRSLRMALVLAVWLLLAAASRDRAAVWRDTESLWRDTLAVNPTSTLAHNNLGVALVEAGRMDEARLHFEASLRLRPGDPTAELNLGVQAAAREDWEEATARYKRTLRQQFDSALAWNNLGTVATARGQDRRAAWLFRRALALAPNDADAHLNLGAILARTGRPEDALGQYREATRLAPRLVKAQCELAELLAARGAVTESITHYEEAHRLDPDSVGILTSLVDLLIDHGDLRAAAEYLTAGVARRPDIGWFHLQLGQVLGDLRDTERALAHYERAIALTDRPDEKAEIHVMAAALLNEVGRREEAMARYELALANDPDQLAAHYDLARILRSEGKLQEAARHYREVLRIAPDEAEAAGELASLASGRDVQ